VLTNAEEHIREVKTGGSLGCRAFVEFVILRNTGLAKSSQDPVLQASNLPVAQGTAGWDPQGFGL
jgi:hypothetical protein